MSEKGIRKLIEIEDIWKIDEKKRIMVMGMK